jgi:hypothetical protein
VDFRPTAHTISNKAATIRITEAIKNQSPESPLNFSQYTEVVLRA